MPQPAMIVGSRIGPYEILSELGAGGMGVVYRARDAKLGRDVAIKVLAPSFAQSPDRLARFEREARLLAALNHPHIGAIYGVEDSDGVRALVLELVEGPTVAERIARGPVPLQEALAIARQIADALDAAHQQGIVHRDLKPANIKVRPDDTVKVLDFGLAKIWADDGLAPDLTQSPTVTAGTREGVILGTAAYMSPEQARGKPVDERTDVWAFGCVLYELLTGRRAFEGDTVSDMVVAILGRDPDWDALPRETPAGVRRLLRRCLEKDPRRRLRAIADARLDIEDVIAGEPTDRLSPAGTAPDGNRTWRMIAIASLAALILVAIVSAVALKRERAASSPAPGLPETIATRLTRYGARETGGALAPDGRSFVFVSDHAGAPDIWIRQVSGGEAVRLTNDVSEETDLVYAPDGESIYFARVDQSGPALWRVGVLGGQPRKVLTAARRPALSPDGRSLAYAESEISPPGSPFVGGFGFSLVVSGIDGSRKRTLASGLVLEGLRPAWSPDGRRVSYSQSPLFAPRNLFVIDVETGQVRQATGFTRSAEGIASHAWLPDNRHLVVCYTPAFRPLAPGDLGILDIETGSISRVTMALADGFSNPSLSADGSRVIVTAGGQHREVWKVPARPDVSTNGRADVRVLDSTQDPMWTFVTRDGRTLLFNSSLTGGRNLWTMPLDERASPRQITAVAGDAVMHSSLSPDGSRVAFASSAAGPSDIWIQNVDGSELRQLTDDEAADSWPVWSPDGRSVVFASLRDGSWQTLRAPAAGGAVEKIIEGFFRGDWVPQPDGTGTWIVTSRDAGGLRLVDVERRSILWDQPIQGTGLSLPVFSPDRRQISLPVQEGPDRDAIWIFDAATGERRTVVRFPEPFRIFFRASWVDDGNAFIVNRYQATSHVVLFDRFWSAGRARH